MSTKRKAATAIAKPVVRPSAKAQIKSKIDETRSTVSTGLASKPGSKTAASIREVDGSDVDSNSAEEEEEEVSQDEEQAETKSKTSKVSGTKRSRDEVDQDETMQDGAEASDGEPTSPTFGDLVRGSTTVDVSASLAAQTTPSQPARNGSQQPVVPISATSLGTVLNQALRTDDNDLLESCLQTSDTKIIENTINRMDSALASVLLSKLAARMHRRPGRAFGLMRWMQWTLVAHGGALVTQPDLVARLAELSRVLEERSRGLSSLLALKGKLDMLDSQLKYRKSIKSASAGRGHGRGDDEESSEEEEDDVDAPAVVYVEGQDTSTSKALPNGTTNRAGFDEEDDMVPPTSAAISDSEEDSDADFDEEDDDAADEFAEESLDEDDVDHDDVEEDDEEDEDSDGEDSRPPAKVRKVSSSSRIAKRK
jgi:U3 small nucleolar RNA-associated protein 5|uniref:Small-subunit processome Utp12 domain-containing protein n=1 Tax=Humicola insolens TaxID=85995 RepID=A0A346DKQ5_HUMIN